MYDKDGYFNENQYQSYGISDRTAKKNADGSITIHLGGDPSRINFIPISQGWNYVVRMYRPRDAVVNGTWTFPRVKEIK